MNKTVIEMAREAGAIVLDGSDTTVIERFAELVRADEREACAKVCEQAWNEYCTEPCGYALAVKECVAAIRAGGQA